jgi:type VI secretion system protein VasG
VVKVEEPTESAAVEMMRGLSPKLEKHHGVRILDGAVSASVKLSHRYIPARQLPDKSVSVLDTACARVAIGRSATPAPVEDLHRRLDAFDTETRILQRESALGLDHAERLAEIAAVRAEAAARLVAMEARWKQELELVDRLVAVRTRLEGEADQAGADGAKPPTKAEQAKLRAELDKLRGQLAQLQGEQPLVGCEVSDQTIAEVISGWTGIPTGRMVADEIQTVLHLADRLRERVIGQDHGLEAVARRIRTARAGLDNPSRPVGVFLLVGPSGVGKTETALALAEALYGGERNLITINMSEYQEAHTVSSLKGAPPGYVGYGEGGVLTEAVRRRPYAVVLLDEVEKAHSDVMELFYQVFDKGMLEDGQGREIDFKNTVILLTSNVGSDTIMKLCADPETCPEPAGLAEAIRPELLRQFPAALLGRMVVVPYYPIAGEALRRIIRLQLGRIARRVRENHRVEFVYGDDLLEAIAVRCTEAESGARAIDHLLTQTLLPQISVEFLTRLAASEPFSRVEVVVDQGTFQYRMT